MDAAMQMARRAEVDNLTAEAQMAGYVEGYAANEKCSPKPTLADTLPRG
jgi:hypothetical protein